MAQLTKTPRIYVDWNSYYNAMGIYTSSARDKCNADNQGSYNGMGMLNPTNQRYVVPYDVNCSIRYNSESWLLHPENANWMGILGHNLGTTGNSFNLSLGVDTVNDPSSLYYPTCNVVDDIVNSPFTNNLPHNKIIPEKDGFSIAQIDGFNSDHDFNQSQVKKIHLQWKDIASEQFNTSQLKFGAWCVGNYYDFPHSADVSVKMEYIYDGVQNVNTKGGSTLSNATYLKPADWGDGGAWQLGTDDSGNPIDNLRMGRRSWSVNFSYLSEDHIMPKVAATTNTESTFADDQNPNENTLLDGTDFISSVWNRTLGHHLPFIFQADNTNNSPDQFCLARFQQDSLVVNQTAPNLYSISLKIVETF